jgi:hypothetical protein
MYSPTPAEMIIHGGRIATLDRARPFVSALAIARGRVLAIGDLDRLAAHRTDTTVMINVQGPLLPSTSGLAARDRASHPALVTGRRRSFYTHSAGSVRIREYSKRLQMYSRY